MKRIQFVPVQQLPFLFDDTETLVSIDDDRSKLYVVAEHDGHWLYVSATKKKKEKTESKILFIRGLFLHADIISYRIMRILDKKEGQTPVIGIHSIKLTESTIGYFRVCIIFQ